MRAPAGAARLGRQPLSQDTTRPGFGRGVPYGAGNFPRTMDVALVCPSPGHKTQKANLPRSGGAFFVSTTRDGRLITLCRLKGQVEETRRYRVFRRSDWRVGCFRGAAGRCNCRAERRCGELLRKAEKAKGSSVAVWAGYWHPRKAA